MKTTEYEVRPLNRHGDAQDVVAFPNLEQAKQVAERYHHHGAAAVVVERHEFSGDFCSRLRNAGDRYTVLFILGNHETAKQGGYAQ